MNFDWFLILFSMIGLRMDGRRANELRKMTCKLNVIPRSDGSAFLEVGNTKILCVIYGPREARHRNKIIHDQAFLSCEYRMATFSMSERRRHGRGGDRKSYEIAAYIRQAFEKIIMTTLYPRSQIDIYIQVLQADGGKNILIRCSENPFMVVVIHNLRIYPYIWIWIFSYRFFSCFLRNDGDLYQCYNLGIDRCRNRHDGLPMRHDSRS